MEKYRIFDLFEDTIKEDHFNQILEEIWSVMKHYILTKDIKDLDACLMSNYVLDELPNANAHLSRIAPKNLFQDLEKRKIYTIASLFTLSTVHQTIKKEIDFKEEKLESLKYKYAKNFIYFLSSNTVATKVELCEHLKISKSTLNRFLVKIKPYNLYDVKRYGNRINYYYSNYNSYHLSKIIKKMEKISTMFQGFK